MASPATALSAWQRMHVGSAHLARVTLDAPVNAQLPMFGLSLLAAMLLSQFFEHSAWSVAFFSCMHSLALFGARSAPLGACRARVPLFDFLGLL
eukprot:7252226-Prymnesium_polylepis.2